MTPVEPVQPHDDPFPPSEFDQWAHRYDSDVNSGAFPFTGYHQVLEQVVQLAQPAAGMTVLDLGAGTGNLTSRLLAHGCEVWCTDFSSEMLKAAREKIPAARCYLHDLRQPFPPELSRRFDRVVSAYVFHHFSLPEKAAIVRKLFNQHLVPGGRLVIADISFQTASARDTARHEAGDLWDDEPFWIADEALSELRLIDPSAAYTQVSACAGIYTLRSGA